MRSDQALEDEKRPPAGTNTRANTEETSEGMVSAMRLMPRIPGVHSRTGSKESNGSTRSYDGMLKLRWCLSSSSPCVWPFPLTLGARTGVPEIPIG